MPIPRPVLSEHLFVIFAQRVSLMRQARGLSVELETMLNQLKVRSAVWMSLPRSGNLAGYPAWLPQFATFWRFWSQLPLSRLLCLLCKGCRNSIVACS